MVLVVVTDGVSTLKMTTAKGVETSVTTTDSPSQDYTNPDDQLPPTSKACFINPLLATVAFSILLWLTPDDFTRQWETSWPIKG